jgi:hypothetical protein
MVREQILESLAEKYIPEGMHKTLYVNSRENWIEFVLSLLDNDVIKKDNKVWFLDPERALKNNIVNCKMGRTGIIECAEL